MVDVKGRWAFVTGAGRGLGRLAALYLAERGCDLILHARTPEHCEGVKKEAEALGVRTVCAAAELSDMEAVRRMLADIDALGVDVDIVLNNAGLQIAYRTEYFDTPVSDYIESFKINTIAPAMICYHFMPKMIERGFGRIVNTTSGIALEPQQAGYSASKAALDKITIDLGSTVEGTDVCINLADPGWCRTDLGGPGAPNPPESAVPGIVVGAFIDDRRSGRIFRAQDFAGSSLADAVARAQIKYDSPYGK